MSPFAVQAALTSQEIQDLQKIEQHLNSTKTFSASFSQTATDGSVATGDFYLEKPGKLRWQYAPPNPITIVLKGSILSYYDAELDELSNIPINNAIAGFLTQKKIQLINSNEFTAEIDKKGPYSIVTIRNSDYFSEGFLRILFKDEDSFIMKELEYLDPIGIKTSIVFDNILYNTTFEDKLFSIQRNDRFKRN